MPLLVATSSFKFTDMFFFVVYLIMIKNLEFEIQHLCMKVFSSHKRNKIRLIFLVTIFAGSSLLVFLSPLVGIAYAFIMNGLWLKYGVKYRYNLQYQWQDMIKQERNRVQRIYQFINLFTDVPILKSTVRRRKYLDVFLNKNKKDHEKTFNYLYTRAFLRGTEYSGLFIRLSLIAMGLMLVVEPFLLHLLVALLFLYLTGFQLIPLYFHFDNMAMAVLYPINHQQKLKAIKAILFKILLIQSFGILLVSLVVLSLFEALLLMATLMVFSLLFSYFYLPTRIKKMQRY